MARLTYVLVLAASLAATTARAQSQADIANKLNDEGKQLMFADPPNYRDAAEKFRQAVARVPEPKYFFNLCTALYQDGKFGEAMTACNSVEKNNPSDELKQKTDKLIGKIQDEAKKQNIDLQPTGGGAAPGDTGAVTPEGNPVTPPNGGQLPPPNSGGQPVQGAPAQYAVGRPPEQSVFQAAKPEHHYTWTLGIDLFGGGGRIGRPDYYGSAAGGLRLKADYLVNPASRFGTEVYLQITHLSANAMQSAAAVDQLDIVDIGFAGYKHLCPRGWQRLCLTPLAGAQLALMGPGSQQTDPSSTTTQYAALGLRLQASADLALGPKYEHVLSAMFGINAYTAVFASPAADSCPDPSVPCDAASVGLDKGGAFAYVGLGYTYRFDTPFGQAPLVTLY